MLDLGRIDDSDVLGSGIFSAWRFWSHWLWRPWARRMLSGSASRLAILLSCVAGGGGNHPDETMRVLIISVISRMVLVKDRGQSV